MSNIYNEIRNGNIFNDIREQVYQELIKKGLEIDDTLLDTIAEKRFNKLNETLTND